ncbi:MAG: hypothetical protein AB8G23_05485 [Myxococcota bacterium]
MSVLRFREFLSVFVVLMMLLVGCGDGSNSGSNSGASESTLNPELEIESAQTRFRGLTSAATAGGPSVLLRWNDATDTETTTAEMRYEIYASATSTGQDFSEPVRTTAGGVTSIVISGSQTPLVAEGTPVYFVVRSLDTDDETDDNTTELRAVPMPAAAVAYVSDVAAGPGALGDPADPFTTIQAGVDAVEGAGAGIVLIDSASGGTTYAEEVDLTTSVTSIALYGGFNRFSNLGASPDGDDILASRDTSIYTTTITGAGLSPLADEDVVRVANNGSPTNIDGLTFAGDFEMLQTKPFGFDIQVTNGAMSIATMAPNTFYSVLDDSQPEIFWLDAQRIPMTFDQNAGFSAAVEWPIVEAYPGATASGPGSIAINPGFGIQGTDVDIQISGTNFTEYAATGFTATGGGERAKVRFIGNTAEEAVGAMVVVNGAVDWVRFQNNSIVGRGAIVTDELAPILTIPTTGADWVVADNVVNRTRETSAVRIEGVAPENPAAGGDVSISFSRNNLKGVNGAGIDIQDIGNVGTDGSVSIVVDSNETIGIDEDPIRIDTLAIDVNEGVELNLLIENNKLFNSDSNAIELDYSVSAGETTTITIRDNLISTTENGATDISFVTSGTDDLSDGGHIILDFIDNIVLNSEDIQISPRVPHNGRFDLTMTGNQTLNSEDEGVSIRADGYLGTTTSSYAYPDGVLFVNVFNNDLRGGDDEAFELRGVNDDSTGFVYFGHNFAGMSPDPSEVGIDFDPVANFQYLFENNLLGFGGVDNEPAMDISGNSNDSPSLIMIRNNVFTASGGPGVELPSSGGMPQLVNNTITYGGQADADQGGIQSDSDTNQAYVHNNVIAFNSPFDLEQDTGIIANYSFIGDGSDQAGFGNLSGDPLFDLVFEDLAFFPFSWLGSEYLYGLGSLSAAVDAGDPDSDFNDPDDTRNDMGAYGGPGAGPIGPVGDSAELPLVFLGNSPPTELYTGGTLLSSGDDLTLVFNKVVDTDTVADALTITSGGVEVPGTFSAALDGNGVVFAPSTVLNPGGAGFVDVSIDTDLEDEDGLSLDYPVNLHLGISPGAATAEVEPNDVNDGVVDALDIAAAQDASTGAGPDTFELTSTISTSADIDVYAVSATAGQRLMLTILDSRLVGGGEDDAIRLDLYDATGALLVLGNDDTFNLDGTSDGDAYLDYVAPANGDYFVVVSNEDLGAGPQAYRLLGVLR